MQEYICAIPILLSISQLIMFQNYLLNWISITLMPLEAMKKIFWGIFVWHNLKRGPRIPELRNQDPELQDSWSWTHDSCVHKFFKLLYLSCLMSKSYLTLYFCFNDVSRCCNFCLHTSNSSNKLLKFTHSKKFMYEVFWYREAVFQGLREYY